MPLPPIRMLLPLLFCGICGACSDLGETLGLKEQLEGVRSRLSPCEWRHSDALGPSPAGLSRSPYFWCRLLNTAHDLAPFQTLQSNTGQSEFSRLQVNRETVRSYEQNMKVKYRSWVDTMTLGGYCGHAHQQELQWHPTGDRDKKNQCVGYILITHIPGPASYVQPFRDSWCENK